MALPHSNISVGLEEGGEEGSFDRDTSERPRDSEGYSSRIEAELHQPLQIKGDTRRSSGQSFTDTQTIPSSSDIVIAVFGVKGCGKSTFISELVDEKVGIAHGLFSRTKEVQFYSFEHQSRRVVLMDTPDFDDTDRSDTETLRDISIKLSQLYEDGIGLSGIVYLHDIIKPFSVSAMKTLMLLKALCGEKFYKHIMLATAGWEYCAKECKDAFVYYERELCESYDIWRDLVSQGTKVFRYTGDPQSAKRIISSFTTLGPPPKVLNIQRELVDENKRLEDTTAGMLIQEGLQAKAAKLGLEIARSMERRGQALKARDQQLAELLEEQRIEERIIRERMMMRERMMKERLMSIEKDNRLHKIHQQLKNENTLDQLHSSEPNSVRVDNKISGRHEHGLTGTGIYQNNAASSSLRPVQLTRISNLIKTELQLSEGLQVSSDPEEKISGPNLFGQSPKMYQDDIANLHQRIFHLGESALRNLEDRGDTHVLSPPSSTPSGPSDRVRILMTTNIDLMVAINDGLKHLVDVGFCGPRYSVIVTDPSRADVLLVIPIKENSLQVLQSLLEELASCYGSPTEDDLLEETIDDTEEAIMLILRDLRLAPPVANCLSGVPIARKLEQISQLVFSALSVLFLGLVSFVTSHLCIVDGYANLIGQMTIKQLMIMTPGGSIHMASRRLLCLDGFIKSPVWVFSASSNLPGSNHNPSASEFEGRRYYVSVFLADFADLWGPMWLQYLEDSKNAVSEVMVHGGVIRRVADQRLPGNQGLGAEETLCHWSDWTDLESRKWPAPGGLIGTTHRLCIGTPDIHMRFNNPSFLVSRTCTCDGKKWCPESRDAFELNTRIPFWSLDGRTAQLSGGAYVHLQYGQTWKFNAGWTLKDVIVVDWVEQAKEPSHSPKPFYLDYLVVLNISKCTGHSRRVSLWSLFHEDTLRKYLRQALDERSYRDFKTLIQYFPPSSSFLDIWKSISKEAQEIFKLVVKEVLTILRSTGVGEDGYLQAWDVTSYNRLDGRKAKLPWGAMVKDDSACATFAIVTDTCVSFKAMTPPPSPPNNATSTHNPILHTIICITTEESVLSMEPRTYTPPISLKEEDARPDWALTRTAFEKWKVKLSKDDSSPLASSRKQAMESSRDQAGPDPETLKRLEMRRLARQSRRQQVGNGDINSPRQAPKNSSFVNRALSKSPVEKIPGSGNFDETSSSREPSNRGKRLTCESSFHFQNGTGKNIGKLILEPPQIMDIRTVTEGSALTMRWEESKSGLMNAVKTKEKALDKQVFGWTERKMTGVLPWAVSRMAESCSPEPFVVEHIRGGTLGAGQKVLQTYIS